MKQFILLFCIMCCSAQAANKPASKEQCRKWQQQLDKVNTELRAGYKTERGNKLRKRRRELQSKLHRRCRK
ncbi:hypothetical protein QSV34_05600 [Porticoccus sp. W117]|uniref:hypothetical protein n=1 Tax=Porticoccus sp. W117 TaxID=3054777 RepID=UPI0025920570|nr:hypothetical protein [Porticoccus sp. W117]MDM3870825.1 hypothetical protein [Porticoccus sp. W117]